jgi:hypothetical protein
MIHYSEEMKVKILEEFRKHIGEPFTTGKIRKNGGVALFIKITGKNIGASSINNLLNKLRDPEGFKAKQDEYLRNRKGNPKVDLGSGNALFKLAGESNFVLVPSHGDCYCYSTVEEVKTAIEEFKAKNSSPITFKLFKQLSIQVKTTVDCVIG